MNKIINPGKINVYGTRKSNIFCRIQTKETDKGLALSIAGVIGPRSNGNAAGGCGQIIMEFKEYDRRGYSTLDDITLAKGWSADMLKKFFDIWDRWHLNDLNAGCEHQEAAIRDSNFDEVVAQGLADSVYDIVRGSDLRHCDVCDYTYGTAWKFEAIPADVLEFLASLPDTKITPAWV